MSKASTSSDVERDIHAAVKRQIVVGTELSRAATATEALRVEVKKLDLEVIVSNPPRAVAII